MQVLPIDASFPYQQLIGVGGLGTGIFFALEGEQTLGRNESRPGKLLDVRDYCKLHIVSHYVAKLLRNQCFRVFPVGRVGSDAAGQSVLRELADAGIDTRFVETITERPTLFSVCFQYPDGTGGNITTNNSAANELCASDLEGVKDVLASTGSRTVALSLPEVSLDLRRHFLQLATREGAFRAASFVSAEIAAAKELRLFEQVDLLSLNESEAGEVIGDASLPESSENFMKQCVQFLDAKYPHLQIVVSAGKAGAYAVSCDRWNYCPAPQVEVASTAGAGDCLLGGILAAMAAGVPLLDSQPPRKALRERPLETALEFGVLLASYKVTSPHTIHPDASLPALIRFANQKGVEFAPSLQQAIHSEPTRGLSSRA
jgi:sugar/nucleoside kinase (ribokinase family)